MRGILRDNGLTLALLGLFAFSLAGQSIAGEQVYNDELLSHGQAAISFWSYLISGHFVESVFENWESEFLQMGVYVVLTATLHQRGSAESKSMDESEDVDQDPREARRAAGVPWPVRRGGWVLALYERSLSIALLALFLLSFVLHAAGGAREYSREQLLHGEQAVSMLSYMLTSQFWFESFQNWQSEFLSIAAIVVLSIFLRQRGSPESKPVAAPHEATGARASGPELGEQRSHTVGGEPRRLAATGSQ